MLRDLRELLVPSAPVPEHSLFPISQVLVRGTNKQGLGERPMARGGRNSVVRLLLSPTSSVGRPPEASQLPPEA